MSIFSIATQQKIKILEEDLRNAYVLEKKTISSIEGEYPYFDFKNLDYIFEVACKHRKLFPSLNIDKNTPENLLVSSYLHRWILTYCNSINTLPSQKKASPKSSCSDPVVKKIIQQIHKLNDESVNNQEVAHTIFMAAENVIGNLLEEYIASEISTYGWIWCAGTTLKAIDFCNTSGKLLLQIKNKNNSENSSSKLARKDTKILKWHRLGTSIRKGILTPVYNWDKLNKIINSTKQKESQLPDCNMTEASFVTFVVNTVIKNPEIIA